jgi:hypothetical protein
MFNFCRTPPVLLIAGSLFVASACSVVVDAGREQCSADRDCLALGQEFADSTCVSSLCQPNPDPNWACLDEGATVTSALLPSQVRIIVPFLNVVSHQPTPGINVQACERLDADCSMPTTASVSNSQGEADLRLPGGFNGYLRWEAEGIYPTMYFFGAPLLSDAIFPVNVITPQVFDGLNAQFKGAAIEGRSAVVVNVQTCTGAPAAGVTLTVPEGDSATHAYYMLDGLFPPSQAETSVAGVARVINVPQGNITITGALANGRQIGTAAVLTRTGFATVTNLAPAP